MSSRHFEDFGLPYSALDAWCPNANFLATYVIRSSVENRELSARQFFSEPLLKPIRCTRVRFDGYNVEAFAKIKASVISLAGTNIDYQPLIDRHNKTFCAAKSHFPLSGPKEYDFNLSPEAATCKRTHGYSTRPCRYKSTVDHAGKGLFDRTDYGLHPLIGHQRVGAQELPRPPRPVSDQTGPNKATVTSFAGAGFVKKGRFGSHLSVIFVD
jgi:hypothetical protein